MESATRPTQSTTTEVSEEVNVLVTGFGVSSVHWSPVAAPTLADTRPRKPFRDAPLSNPSTRIAESLPPVLPQSIAHPTRTNIFVRPEPVPVSYEAVNELVPAMLEERTKYHVVLHLGLAAERTWYSLEMSAHSDGYMMQDVEGVRGRSELQPQHWALCPAQLQSSVSAQDVLHRWQSEAEVSARGRAATSHDWKGDAQACSSRPQKLG